MKTSSKGLLRSIPAVFLLLSGILSFSCNKITVDNGQGTLVWNFNPSLATRSLSEIPDTDAFILKVSDSSGELLYNGKYGDSPEALLVNPGTYTVSAVSREFSTPEFDAPQFGDEQVVIVKAGAETKVLLDCSQLNCGLRLRISHDFLESYPSGSLSVSSEGGSLVYGSASDRTGFFKPGNLTVVLDDGQNSTRLLSRFLEARQMLTLGIACPSAPGISGSISSDVSISLDTLRTWTEDEFIIGSQETDSGVTIENAYGVGQAKSHAGEKGVWVCGYIVGGDLSSSKNGIRFTPPFESMTCIAIAARSSVSEKASCMSVQLVKGPIREKLNLVENPQLLSRKVYLKGDIESSYYGIPGMKNLSEFSFE